MKEASFDDARAIARQLDMRSGDVWRIIKGARYASLGDLSMLVHRALKGSTLGGLPEAGPVGGSPEEGS